MAQDSHPTTTTTIPSDPTIPTEAKPSKPPPPPPNRSLVRRLRFLIYRYVIYLARRTDRNLVRLSKLLSTPAGTDALLATVSYTLELVHALLSRILERRLTNIATDIAEKAEDVLFPGETLIATLPASESTKILAQIVGSSKALAAVIGDFRIFVRMWGLVGIYTWARGTWNAPLGKKAGRKEKVLRSVTWAQIVSCVLFQALENGAYLSSKGALTGTGWVGEIGKARETWWWIVSSRFWAAHVFLELFRLAVVYLYRERSIPSPPIEEEKEKFADGEKEGKLLKEARLEEEKKENWLWWRDLVSNIAYAPMTLHWSVEEEQGFLSNWGIAALGATAGGALLVDAWKGTA